MACIYGQIVGDRDRAYANECGRPLLTERRVIAARGGRKGRYYTPSTEPEAPATVAPLAGTNVIIAEVFKRGGRISGTELVKLVRHFGYDPRTVGILHGRRLAHLRRDKGSDESVLTARGEEVARQYLFAVRLAERAKEPT